MYNVYLIIMYMYVHVYTCIHVHVCTMYTTMCCVPPHRSEWSEEGCVVNEALSSAETTVCDCNHLTHFAVMLSPKDSVGAYTCTCYIMHA